MAGESRPEESGRLARRPQAIQQMFAAVARRYDLLNRLLSLRRDVAWRRRLIKALAAAPPGAVLDLATGTGDVALAIADRTVFGADFCLDMLAIGARKAQRAGRSPRWVAADALTLPFRARAFAAVTVAFGVRNFADLDTGVAEVRRVLIPGGLLAILEFHRPPGRGVALFSALWNRAVVTPVGSLLSDDPGAYAYLPASVDSFPDRQGLATRLVAGGFEDATVHPLSGGIVVVTVARRREAT